MNVVAADVTHAGDDGSEVDRIGVARGDRVHVGTIANDRSGPPPSENRHDSMPSHARADLKPHPAEMLRDERGGSRFLAGDIGVAMDVAPDLDQGVPAGAKARVDLAVERRASAGGGWRGRGCRGVVRENRRAKGERGEHGEHGAREPGAPPQPNVGNRA